MSQWGSGPDFPVVLQLKPSENLSQLEVGISGQILQHSEQMQLAVCTVLWDSEP